MRIQPTIGVGASIPSRQSELPSRAPDIEDLARRGRLPGTIVTYRLDDLDGQLFIQASGHSTATVNTCVIGGFAKDIHDAREFSRQFGEHRLINPDLIRQKFKNLRWLPDACLQTSIIDGRGAQDHETTSMELFSRLLDAVPRLRQWPPPMLDERTYFVRQGEIADRYFEELQKINNACRKQKLATYALRSEFPIFALWQELDGLNPAQKAAFDSHFPTRGTWKAQEIRDCVAALMGIGSGHTVKRWRIHFRRWKRRIG